MAESNASDMKTSDDVKPLSELVLTSTSRYRRALLERLGLPFRCVAPRICEEDWKQGEWSHRELAERLAIAKAESVREIEPHSILIGSDQVVSFEGRVFGKPGSHERAVEQLAAMTGRSHALITAVAISHKDDTLVHVDTTIMTMRPLSLSEIERYVTADQPLDCAGSYKLEERGIALFERVDTSDYTAITGLPLIAVTTYLRQLGFPIP